jgi:putative oxidoreductase
MRAIALIRIGAGVIFVVFGLAKFVKHAEELEAFERYDLPAPGVMVYAVGVLEVVGGLALIAAVGVAFAALLLACNMAVAIVVSGLGEGEAIPSLTLAPLLLAVMLLLLWNERNSARFRLRSRSATGPSPPRRSSR